MGIKRPKTLDFEDVNQEVLGDGEDLAEGGHDLATSHTAPSVGAPALLCAPAPPEHARGADGCGGGLGGRGG